MKNYKMRKQLVNVFNSLEEKDIVKAWNDFCEKDGRFDDLVFDMKNFNAELERMDPIDLAAAVHYGNFEPNNSKWFYFDSQCHIHCTSSIYDSNIDVYDIIDFVIENRDTLGIDELEGIVKSVRKTA